MLLSGNEFTGSLDGPKFQNDFFNVVEVAIGNNNLNGTIPTELGTLGKLGEFIGTSRRVWCSSELKLSVHCCRIPNYGSESDQWDHSNRACPDSTL
mmetsp:Transcript_1139/g.2905  ORF Transcript_1139/g.2905 Transcript_1139/m.2905 type:complete len:96 (-) Transcript_1139:386-673(-)